MTTKTNDERYNPKVLKNIRIRQAASPAIHSTVAFQTISRGIITNVTIKSAMDRCMINMLTLDLSFLFLNNVIKTVRFPIAAITKKHEYAVIETTCCIPNCISSGNSSDTGNTSTGTFSVIFVILKLFCSHDGNMWIQGTCLWSLRKSNVLFMFCEAMVAVIDEKTAL